MGWVAFLGLPWVQLGDDSLFRVDLARPALILAGESVALDASIPVFFALLGLLMFFLLGIVLLGRLWCGWACPQTLLSDLAETLQHSLGLHRRGKRPRILPSIAWHGVLAAVSVWLGATTVWYFVSPFVFAPALLAGELHPVATGTLAAAAVLIYVNMAFVRRHFCRTICPYGRFQAALIGPETLGVRFEEAPDNPCLDCTACVRVCPTGTDIRTGAQAECIHCGRCIDACVDVLVRKQRSGLIAYRWQEQTPRPKLLTARVAVLGGLLLLFVGALVYSARTSQDIRLYVRRSPAPPRITADGSMALLFTAVAANRTEQRHRVSLSATDADGRPLRVQGQASSIVLAPSERRRLSFAIVVPMPDRATDQRMTFLLSPEQQQLLSEPVSALVTLEPLPTPPEPASPRP